MSSTESNSRRKQSRPKPIKRSEAADHPSLPPLPASLSLQRHSRQDEELKLVVSAEPLGGGRRFGPYDVSEASEEDEEFGCVIQISFESGAKSYSLLNSEESAWLRLLRLDNESTNATIFVQESKIWLEMTKDVKADTELVASVRELKAETKVKVEVVERSSPMEEAEESHAKIWHSREVKPELAPKQTEVRKPETAVSPPSGDEEHESRIHICPNCTVRFSSLSTLEAHITYYCVKRDHVTDHVTGHVTSPGRVSSPDDKDSEMDVDDDSHQPMKKRRRFSVAGLELLKANNPEEEDGNKPFRCPHCPFVSAKRTNLHCHMRNMHRNPYKSQESGEDEIKIPELYCAECKIQFSATKTYTAHKTYYCGRRKSEPEEHLRSALNASQISALTGLPPQVFVTPMLLPNGTPILMQPVFMPMSEEKPKMDNPESSRLLQEQPLDLTVKKSPTLDKNQNDIKKPSQETEKASKSDDVDQIDGLGQAYNICSSCKIVFYKYENFMIHKQYYCRGRQDENGSNDGGEERTTSPLAVTCSPCNITFKSQVTLEAHQHYYCPHRERKEQQSDDDEQQSSMYVCRKCGREYATPKLFRMHFCDKSKQAEETWSLHRCTRCNFVTHKETAFVEHMRKHAAINGYRCQICGYKGNTVRGMRMHGKMMHPELGDSFMDSQVVELHKFPNEIEQKVDPDLESEIIRLKSEPYKRRRSKYHRQTVQIPHMVETKAELAPEKVTFKCNVCDISFTGSSDDHVREFHSSKSTGNITSPKPENKVTIKEELNEEIEEELDPVTVDDDNKVKVLEKPRTPIKELSSPKATTSHVQLSIPKIEIKTEPRALIPTTVEPEDDYPLKESPNSRHCDDCNITFKFSHSFSAHKKYYCRARSFAPARDVTFSPPPATVD